MSSSVEKMHDLVRRVAAGDSTAEAELVAKFSRPVAILLLQRTGDPSLADDLRQETFLVVLQRLRAGEVHTPEALPAFIRSTAANLVVEHFRREKRYLRRDDEMISSELPLEDRAPHAVDHRIGRAALERVLEQLSVPRDREVLRRFYLGEEDKERICADLDLSAAHFDRVLYRARQRMKDLVAQQKGLKTLLFGSLFDG